MSHASESLRPGEQLVFETRLSLVPVVLSVFWAWCLAFIPTGILILRYFKTEFAITNRRIMVKHGWLSTTTDEASLDKIQNISFRQGLFGKMFGYGTVVIQTAATFGADKFRGVNNPRKLREVIGVQIDAYREEHLRQQAEAIAKGIRAAQ